MVTKVKDVQDASVEPICAPHNELYCLFCLLCVVFIILSIHIIQVELSVMLF